MNSEESEIKTEFNFLKFMEDWKPPADVSVEGIGMNSRNNQKGPTLSQRNETENSKEIFDASESPILRLEVEAKQEIKEEPTNEVFMEIKTEIEIEDWKPTDESEARIISSNQKGPTLSHVNEKENSKDFFDASESPIIKLEVEVKQEIKDEPMDEVEGVHVGSNNDVVKRASDISNICFDHKNNIPIKKEIKQEIKSEPLDEVFIGQNEDLVNVDTHSEKGDPQRIIVEPKVLEMVGVQTITYYQKRKSKKNCKCDFCGKIIFGNKGSQKQHKKSHEKPRKCEYCLKDFNNTLKLKGHIWKVHQCATKHDCLFCKKSFNSFNDLTEHLKNCDEKAEQSTKKSSIMCEM